MTWRGRSLTYSVTWRKAMSSEKGLPSVNRVLLGNSEGLVVYGCVRHRRFGCPRCRPKPLSEHPGSSSHTTTDARAIPKDTPSGPLPHGEGTEE